MNWIYLDETNTPLPKFSVDGFRRKMRNKSLVFVGSSLMRQQVLALSWTLGHKQINWTITNTPVELEEKFGLTCTAIRYCFTDTQDNITLCFQFMGSMATKVYHEEINLAAPASGSRRLRSSDDKRDGIVEEVKDKKDEECLADKYDSYPWSYIVEKPLIAYDLVSLLLDSPPKQEYQ